MSGSGISIRHEAALRTDLVEADSAPVIPGQEAAERLTVG